MKQPVSVPSSASGCHYLYPARQFNQTPQNGALWSKSGTCRHHATCTTLCLSVRVSDACGHASYIACLVVAAMMQLRCDALVLQCSSVGQQRQPVLGGVCGDDERLVCVRAAAQEREAETARSCSSAARSQLLSFSLRTLLLLLLPDGPCTLPLLFIYLPAFTLCCTYSSPFGARTLWQISHTECKLRCTSNTRLSQSIRLCHHCILPIARL